MTITKRIYYYLIAGNALLVLGFFIFTLRGNAIIIIVFVATGMGFYASNSTALIVSIVGERQAATAIGLIFVIQYALLSIVIPILNNIGNSTVSIIFITVEAFISFIIMFFATVVTLRKVY